MDVKVNEEYMIVLAKKDGLSYIYTLRLTNLELHKTSLEVKVTSLIALKKNQLVL